jgi:hypothetical protein
LNQRSYIARSRGRRGHRRLEDLGLEFRVVLAHHRDLQLLARAEVREHARLAHLRDLGERADRQALEPHVRGQGQRGVENRGARLAALQQRARGRSVGGEFAAGRGVVDHGALKLIEADKTNGRAILRMMA